ncbi:MAG: hypothetical protein ACO3HN_01840 [Opitutales bacterium]
MRSELFLALLAGWVTLSPALRGQSENFVEAKIRFIAMKRPLVGVGVVNNRKAQGLVIPTDMFAEEVSYRGPARLELVQMTASKGEEAPIAKDDEKPAKEAGPRQGVKGKTRTLTYSPAGTPPLAWIDLPAKQGLLHLIILVTPGQGNGMVMLNDKPGSFPPGSNRYLNLCPAPLTIRTPAGDNIVPAGDSRTFRPGALDTNYYEMQVLSGEAKVLFSSRIYHLESTRKLYVLSPVGTTGRIELKSIVDRPPPAKAKGLTAAPPK